MTEMLQGALDRDDANEVLRASATHLMPGVAGALYVFNNSRDRLDLRTRWPGTEPGEPEVSPDHIAPSACWALKRGKSHRNHVYEGALRCTHCGSESPNLEIPMAARGELYGLLQLTARGANPDQTLDELQEIAGSVADSMSLALSSIALREQLRMQALRDQLTGLINRRFMEEMLVRFTQEAGYRHLPTSAVMIDLDHFKLLNDQYGHPAGDTVLRHVPNIIASLVRPELLPVWWTRCLARGGDPLKLHRAEIADGRVASPRVVETLNVVEHVSACLIAGAVDFARCAFGFERGEEALHGGVVPDVARAAHATDNTIVGHQLLKLLAGVLGGFKWSSQHRDGG